MKKIIILFNIFISLLTLPVWAEDVSKPTTIFDPINLSISGQVDIAPLKIESGIVKSVDCYQSTEVGRPSLPIRSFFLLLPPNYDVKNVTITQIEQIKLEGEYEIKPVSPPIPISKEPKKLETILLEDFYPKDVFNLNSIQKLRGYTLACISVFGASYNPKTKELIWNRQINFKLNLAQSKIKGISTTTIRNLKEDEDLIKELVVNPQLLTTYTSPQRLIQKIGNTYELVVITNDNLVPAFERLCTSKPMTTKIVTTLYIYNNFSGGDNQEKIRNFIRHCYNPWHTKYVLLGGDVEIVPYRGVYAKVLTENGYEIDYDIPCDLYYACLEGNWDENKNKIYGEFADNVDLLPEVWIGRAPVNNLSEANNFVNKVISAQKSSDDYIYNLLLIASILDEQGNDSKKIMEEIANLTPKKYTIYKEYESYGGGYKENVTQRLNSGVGFVAHSGHSHWNILGLRDVYFPKEELLIDDVNSLTNGFKTFIFNSSGCSAGAFDVSDCIGEAMLLNSNGGAVAFIGNSRDGWYDQNDVTFCSGEYQIEFFKKLFKEGYTHVGEILGKSKIKFISRSESGTSAYRWIMFCLNLLGDPTMEFRLPKEIFWIDSTIPKVINKPGEKVNLTITLKNLTNGTITKVIGTLTTTDPYITIIKDTASFGDMPPTKISTNNQYEIIVKSDCPPIHNVNFLLKISGNEGGYTRTETYKVKINLKVDYLDKVISYPNPCYPNKGDIVKIAYIPIDSNPKVYIYTIAGELVRILDKEDSEIKKYPGSEVAEWDGKNDVGEKVASGIYIYVLKCNLGIKRGKIAILR